MSESASNGVFRSRDLSVMLLAVLAIYLSLDSNSLAYTLTPCWYAQDKSAPRSNIWPSIPPIVTDLDGDGSNEVVFISKDMKLKILNSEAPNNDYSDIYTPELIRSTSLGAAMLNVKTGRSPVVMKTGYIDPYSEIKQRTQVIVILREDWTILCYDNELNLKWEKSISHKTHHMNTMLKSVKIAEASITISPLHFHKEGDSSSSSGSGSGSSDHTGIIVVGASMEEKDKKKIEHGVLHKGMDSTFPTTRSSSSSNTNANANANTNTNEQEIKRLKEQQYEKDMSSLNHFSIYSLSAVDGQIIWGHDGMNVDSESFKTSLPQHLYKLEHNTHVLNSQSNHASYINTWSIFKHHLIASLPHQWSGIHDTTLNLAHYERHHLSRYKKKISISSASTDGIDDASSGADTDTDSSNSNKRKLQGNFPKKSLKPGKSGKSSRKVAAAAALTFSGLEMAPLSSEATLPHDASEHTNYPNVVVAHTKRGIEVISLKTGVPITSLSLSEDEIFHDLNNDGVIDHIKVINNIKEATKHGEKFGHNNGGYPEHCSMIVLSGLPATHQLFNGTICRKGHTLQDPMNMHSYNANNNPNRKRQNIGVGTVLSIPDFITAARPLIMKVPNKNYRPIASASVPERVSSTNSNSNSNRYNNGNSNSKVNSFIESQDKDVIFAINTGVVTSYTGKGEYNWQITNQNIPTWNDNFLYSTVIPFDSDSERVNDIGTHDNMYGSILIQGDRGLGIISQDGYVLATIDVPSTPVNYPCIGDFDNDGITDIIIVTADAILGYKLEVVVSGHGFLIVVILIVLLVFCMYLSTIKIEYRIVDDSTAVGVGFGTSVGVGGEREMRVFTSKRSTDDYTKHD